MEGDRLGVLDINFNRLGFKLICRVIFILLSCYLLDLPNNSPKLLSIAVSK